VSRFLWTVLFGLIFLIGQVLYAESCPWINSATASGILGGPVEGGTTHPAKDLNDGTCEFSRRNGPETRVMHIEVITDKGRGTFQRFEGQCGSPATPRRDLGSEALECAGRGRGGKVSEQVIGRVRDRTFVVRVANNDKSASRSLLLEQARSAAAQVAGNLF
jgi:hypothetical protein